ncbi:MAG: carboxypeptidase regulatory-like domain-containing protein [Clostridia bacterium]|nr:carboxypeptidase regulatory-like domain-containing protein [Clostridia bacterium]
MIDKKKKYSWLLVILLMLFCLPGCDKTSEVLSKNDSVLENKVNTTSDDEWALPEKDDVYKDQLMDFVFSYLDENPLLRINYYPIENDDFGRFYGVIENNGIDLSDYVFKGDLNGDGFIDEKDLDLWIEGSLKSDEYCDLDENHLVDYRDLICLSERLLTEIKGFSFYVDGVKLDIPLMPYHQNMIDLTPYNLALKDHTEVLIVPEDSNGASGENPLPPPSMNAESGLISSEEIDDIVNELLYGFEAIPNYYLVSWSASLSYVAQLTEIQDNPEDNVVENVGLLEDYLTILTDTFNEKVGNLHFQYNMKKGVHTFPFANKWLARAGLDYSSKNASGYRTDMASFKKTQLLTLKTDEDGRSIKQMIAYRNTILTATDYSGRTGMILVAGWNHVNGKLDVQRMGPGFGQDDILHQVIISDNEIPLMEPIYSGDYKVTYTTTIDNFSMILNPDQVYRHEEHPYFNVVVPHTVKVMGRLVTKGKEPIPGVRVEILSLCPDLGIENIDAVYTDDNGNFVLNEVPYGLYDLKFDGEVYTEVCLDNVEELVHNMGDLMLEGTFDIELQYSNYMYGYELTAYWNDVDILNDLEGVPLLTYQDMLYPETGEKCKPLMDLKWPDEYFIDFNMEEYQPVYDIFEESEPVYFGIIQEIINNESDDIKSQGSIYFEIQPNFTISYGGYMDMFYYCGPVMGSYIKYENVKKSDGSAGPNDGDMTGFIGAINSEEFLGIFNGETYEREGVSRSHQGTEESYRIIIKLHEEE